MLPMLLRLTAQSTTLVLLAASAMGTGLMAFTAATNNRTSLWTNRSQSSAPLLPNGVPKSCPVTKPALPPFVPPPGYPAEPGPDYFWFGTLKLWTNLPADGAWRGLGHYTPDDPTFRQKLFFWRQGYKVTSESRPALKVTGRRMDGPAPALQRDRPNGSWQDNRYPFIVTGVNFPTLGCWEVTAAYREDKLTFIVWLE